MRLTKTLVTAAVFALGLAAAIPAAAQSRGGHGGGRSATSAPHGTAVARPPAVVRGGGVYAGRAVVAAPYRGYYRPYYYRPFYYPYRGYYCCPYGYGGFGLSFGVGFGYPYGYAAYPYAYGYPYPYPYPYYGAPYPYPYPSAAYPPYGSVGVQAYGTVRIDIPQRDAEVYVDGNFAGTVDENNGSFNLEAGTHHIEVRAPGFAATSFDVSITPGRTTTYRTALRPQ